MAVWDASQLKLISAHLALEDPSSPAGQVWNKCVLQYAQSRPGNTSVHWQRCERDSSIIYLIRGWTDQASQTSYRDQSLSTTAIDVYLAHPSEWLSVADHADFMREHSIRQPLLSAEAAATVQSIPPQSTSPQVPQQLSDLFTSSRTQLDSWRAPENAQETSSAYPGPQLTWRPPASSDGRACFAADGRAAWPRADATTPRSTPASPARPWRDKWVETVELQVRRAEGEGAGGLGAVHRRALHYYMLEFCRATSTDTHETPAVEATTLSHAWLSDDVYVARFYVASPAARAAWVREFVGHNYEILGSKAHAIGCVAEVVASETTFVRGSIPAVDEGFVSDGDDHDLGF